MLTIYLIGYVIAFILAVWLLGSDARRCKRDIARLKKNGAHYASICDAEDDYKTSLHALFFGSIFIPLVWPFFPLFTVAIFVSEFVMNVLNGAVSFFANRGN